MFSISTFNVLADVNIKIYPQMYEELVLEGPKNREEIKVYNDYLKVDELLEKTNRYIKIIEQLNELKSDIFCLQEVQDDLYEYLMIFAKQNDYYITEMHSTYTGESEIVGDIPKNGLVNLLSKKIFKIFSDETKETTDERIILLSFFHDYFDKKYCIFNCHLSCSEKANENGSGEKELNNLINYIKKYEDNICIVCGDFNNHPHYSYENNKYKGHIWKLVDNLGMNDAYLMKGFTYCNKYQFKPMKKFDYIFYFDKQLFKRSIKWLKLPDKNIVNNNKKSSKTTLKWFLENFGSDHQPLTAYFCNIIDHKLNVKTIIGRI
jgi:mRNA deadenylase 3'-5' endonuclease subunit Ccr4